MSVASEQLAGVSLPRGYTLERFLEETNDGAFYLTSQSATDSEPPRPALLKLVPGHAAVSGQLAAWEKLAGQQHPNVLSILDCGRAGPLGPAGTYYLYAVFEYPDDSLAAAVDAHLLTESDSRDVLAAADAALQFLHARGLAHTAIDVRHIVAVGDRVKLATDTVKLLGPGVSESDDWQALATLRRRLLGSAGAADAVAAAPAEIAAPLIAQAAAAAARAEETPPAHLPFESTVEQPRRTTLPLWGYIVAAIAVVALLILVLRPKPAPTGLVPPPVQQPAVTAKVPVEPVRRPSAMSPPPSAEPSNWRVVAYTYNRRKDADHKVAQINAKFPGFVPEVFTPNGSGSPPYLVALGGRMTRNQARSLRSQVLAKGLPSGTYVQNFKN